MDIGGDLDDRRGRMAGVGMSADDLLAEWLVNMTREQRQRRFWGFRKISGSSREAPSDGTEQIPEREPQVVPSTDRARQAGEPSGYTG
ncbi:hypothetical protein AAH991_36445 [Microbispora sp. ZYX-F-249]|uniref:Uncharacterized protein n=1 Tax=Microbispora maris TaxID=3144104 RepID=A0ABV0AZG2_9ACTN